MDELDQLLQQLGPDGLQQLLQLGGVDEQQGMLDSQMAQAQALRRPSGAEHSTSLGGGLGAAGDAVNALNGTMQIHDVQAQKHGLLDQQTAGRRALIELLRKSKDGAPPAMPMGPPGILPQRAIPAGGGYQGMGLDLRDL